MFQFVPAATIKIAIILTVISVPQPVMNAMVSLLSVRDAYQQRQILNISTTVFATLSALQGHTL